MQRLKGLDATFLYTETPSNHMHVGSVIILDPSTVPGGYRFEQVRALVDSRLPLLPPFRRRLKEVPFGFHHPVWVEDPDFDLDYHLRRAALPAPGGRAELEEFAAAVFGRPLDRSRPLWEIYVVEGLEHGYLALVSKMHHAAIDGVSGAELTVNLLDVTPEPVVVPSPDPPWHPDRLPTDVEMALFAMRSLARQPVDALRAVQRTASMALRLRQRNRRADVDPPPAYFSAPKTSLSTRITPHRRFAMTEIPLDDVKMVKNRIGGTVNDVVLALCAGALRTWLRDRGELPDQDLVGFVPISVRTEDERGAMGNRVSAMLVRLATTVADPLERLGAIRDSTASAKQQENAISAAVLTDWTEFAAPAVAARAARLVSRLRVVDRLNNAVFNVVISNVPGPAVPLYSAGARVLGVWPMGPITDGAGLNITVMSYLGALNFGLVACRELAPDLDALADALVLAMEELRKAVGTADPAPRKAKRGGTRPPRAPAPSQGAPGGGAVAGRC
jgi:diacylglycerol O-acyltransferase